MSIKSLVRGKLRGHRCIALYRTEPPDVAHYLRIPLHWGDIKTIGYDGRVFRKSGQRTDGGWCIFKERG